MLIDNFKITLLTLVILFSFKESYSQPTQNVLKEAKNLPLANISVKINNLSSGKQQYISKDSLANGIRLSFSDSNYKISSFLFTHDSKEQDVPEMVIFGNQVTLKDAPVLQSLKKGEVLVFSYFKIERNGKLFTLPDLLVIITD